MLDNLLAEVVIRTSDSVRRKLDNVFGSALDKRLDKVAARWSKNLARAGVVVEKAAFFGRPLSGSTRSRDALAFAIADSRVPTAAQWHAALLERWDEVAAQDGGLAGFFQLERAEAAGHLDDLATQLRAECSRSVEHFRTSVVEGLDAIAAAIADQGASEFESLYRSAIGPNLDYMRLHAPGRLVEDGRLSDAEDLFLSVGWSAEDHAEDAAGWSTRQLVRDLNTRTLRVAVRGDAGSGKSCLFRRLAVSIADPRLHPAGEDRPRIPFLVRLRDFPDGGLPHPSDLPGLVNRMLPAPPRGWVEGVLRNGDAVVLLDGVDEIKAEHREATRVQIRSLVTLYPGSCFIVSSRPAAMPDRWLEDLGFLDATIDPMTPDQIGRLIIKWSERYHYDRYDLAARVQVSPPLRNLASNPLCCALLCYCMADVGVLPDDLTSLCEAVLKVLLRGREFQRGIAYRDPGFGRSSYGARIGALGSLAHHLLLNGTSEISTEDAEWLVSRHRPDPPKWWDYLSSLLVRSGVLRTNERGRISFTHDIIRDYLAGWALAESRAIGLMSQMSLEPRWHAPLLFAAGVDPNVAWRLAERLASSDAEDEQERRAHKLVALRCSQSVRRPDGGIQTFTRDLMTAIGRPRRLGEAAAFALLGDLAVPLLANEAGLAGSAAAASVRALGLIGSDQAMVALRGYLGDRRAAVARELRRYLPLERVNGP